MLMGDILKSRKLYLERLIKLTNHSKKKQKHIRELNDLNSTFGSWLDDWDIGGGYQ